MRRDAPPAGDAGGDIKHPDHTPDQRGAGRLAQQAGMAQQAIQGRVIEGPHAQMGFQGGIGWATAARWRRSR